MSMADGLGGGSFRKVDQEGEPSLALHQRPDGRTLTCADDQIAFPVPDLAAFPRGRS